MKQLLVAASPLEIEPFINQYNILLSENFTPNVTSNTDLLISGIGMAETIYRLQRVLTNDVYDRIIQVGIAGSYNYSIELGSIVEVVSDQYGDLGAEDYNGKLISVTDLGLTSQLGITNITNQPMFNFPIVESITVNKAAGKNKTIKQRLQQFSPDIETMEGLALFLLGEQFDIAYSQIRAISNYVEKRDKSKWKLKLAISNLHQIMEENIL